MRVLQDLDAESPERPHVDVFAAQEEPEGAAGTRVVAFEERAVQQRDQRRRVFGAEGAWECRWRGQVVRSEDRVVAFGVAAAAGLGVDAGGRGGLMFGGGGGGGGVGGGLVDRDPTGRGGVDMRGAVLPGGVAGRAEDAGVRAGVGRREEGVLLRGRVHGGERAGRGITRATATCKTCTLLYAAIMPQNRQHNTVYNTNP